MCSYCIRKKSFVRNLNRNAISFSLNLARIVCFKLKNMRRKCCTANCMRRRKERDRTLAALSVMVFASMFLLEWWSETDNASINAERHSFLVRKAAIKRRKTSYNTKKIYGFKQIKKMDRSLFATSAATTAILHHRKQIKPPEKIKKHLKEFADKYHSTKSSLMTTLKNNQLKKNSVFVKKSTVAAVKLTKGVDNLLSRYDANVKEKKVTKKHLKGDYEPISKYDDLQLSEKDGRVVQIDTHDKAEEMEIKPDDSGRKQPKDIENRRPRAHISISDILADRYKQSVPNEMIQMIQSNNTSMDLEVIQASHVDKTL